MKKKSNFLEKKVGEHREEVGMERSEDEVQFPAKIVLVRAAASAPSKSFFDEKLESNLSFLQRTIWN